jgi:phospholipid/cholesterol/gamma-HCH transport system substrate-binding protein
MSRSLTRWQALLLGLVTLLGVGLAGAGLFAVGSRQWSGQDAFHVRAGFRDIRGVEVGTRVRVQGVDAGEVEAVNLPTAPSEPVTLRLRLSGRVRHLVRSDATVQIVSEGMIGGKVLEVSPGEAGAGPVEDDALLASRQSVELADVLAQVDGTLQGVRDGEGALGRELVGALRQTRSTMSSFQQMGEAGKKLPLLRSYITDPQALLVRPDCECNRTVFAEADLFEPGRAVLTESGRQRLDEITPRLNGLLQHDKSDLVVLAFADPRKAANPDAARGVSTVQSEAVCSYLKKQKVQKAGWWTSRKVAALGLGTDLVPGEEADAKLPAARVEVRVFVPQN